MKSTIILGLLLIVGVPLKGLAEETALDRYVAKPDPAYRYTHYLTDRKCGCTVLFPDYDIAAVEKGGRG